METLEKLKLDELKQLLKNSKEKKEQLIIDYYDNPSEELLYTIIDLGKSIGNINFEINVKTVFESFYKRYFGE